MQLFGFNKNTLFSIAFILIIPTASAAKDKTHLVNANKVFKVAVRAHSGIAAAKKRWTKTIHVLNENVDGYQFELVPIKSFREMRGAAKNKKVDFILTNPLAYAEINKWSGLTRLLTLDKKQPGGGSSTIFASVIFSRADRRDINSLDDFNNKSIMGVHEDAFGGWKMALRELLDNDFDPNEKSSAVLFSPNKTHESVVYSVLNGRADIGVVRTGIIEKLIKNGNIKPNSIKVLNAHKDKLLALHSTRHYPEWPFSVMPHVSRDVSNNVFQALLSIQQESPAAIDGKYHNWHAPLNYSEVYNLKNKLDLQYVTFADFWKKHWIALFLSLLLVLAVAAYTFYLFLINKKLGLSKLELSQQKQYLSQTLNSIGDAVITTDEKGNVTRMNPVAERLTGWSLQEAQGQPLKIIFPIVNASTREPIENPVDKVIATGEIFYLSNHTTLISKNGTEYQVADSAAPIRDNSHILGMVLVFNDVTEQYQLREAASKSRKHLQSIMDNSPSAIYVKDLEGKYTFINQQFKRLFQLQDKDIIGKSSDELSSNDIITSLSKNDNYVLKAKQSLESEETAILNNTRYSFLSYTYPLLDDGGNVYSVCGLSTDITEKKIKDEQLRRSQKMDALGKLTGGVAHDFNNMLGVILGYSEIIESMVTEDSELTNYIHEVQHAGERGAKLTKKLLNFSSQQSSENEIVNLNSLLQDSQHMLEKTMTVRISLIYELEKILWPINIDVSDLEDAILNVSINAMHAIEGNGAVTFSTRNEVINEIEAQQLHITGGEYILLSITDTGCGMDNETKEKLFDPFYSTKGELGTGLGLSQVYGLVQRSKGNIKIYSELGHGTRFTLYFPRYHESEIDVKRLEEDEITNLSGNQTILVVDDEPALSKLTSHILAQQGYHVFSANSGEEALLILEKEDINLLISDVIMPEMDGYQLAAIVQKKYPNTKIQMASGFSDDRHVDNINASLQEELLHKPYHSKKLLLRIRELLNGSAD